MPELRHVEPETSSFVPRADQGSTASATSNKQMVLSSRIAIGDKTTVSPSSTPVTLKKAAPADLDKTPSHPPSDNHEKKMIDKQRNDDSTTVLPWDVPIGVKAQNNVKTSSSPAQTMKKAEAPVNQGEHSSPPSMNNTKKIVDNKKISDKTAKMAANNVQNKKVEIFLPSDASNVAKLQKMSKQIHLQPIVMKQVVSKPLADDKGKKAVIKDELPSQPPSHSQNKQAVKTEKNTKDAPLDSVPSEGLTTAKLKEGVNKSPSKVAPVNHDDLPSTPPSNDKGKTADQRKLSK